MVKYAGRRQRTGGRYGLTPAAGTRLTPGGGGELVVSPQENPQLEEVGDTVKLKVLSYNRHSITLRPKGVKGPILHIPDLDRRGGVLTIGERKIRVCNKHLPNHGWQLYELDGGNLYHPSDEVASKMEYFREFLTGGIVSNSERILRAFPEWSLRRAV